MNKFRLGIRFPLKMSEKYNLGYVYFPTEFDREKYISEEFDFCKVEEKAYLSALYTNQRINTVHDLYNKRIQFCKRNKLKIEMTKV